VKSRIEYHICQNGEGVVYEFISGTPGFTSSGWGLFSLERELKRQGITDRWRPCSLNLDYSLCDSYPASVWVPHTVDDATVELATEFRSKGRLPALVWFGSRGNAIVRCAQPLVGLLSKKSSADQKFIEVLT
jgi:myotubularin-related protein 6/7/8